MAPNFNDNNFVYDFVVKQGHGVKGLVDSGILEIPEIYIQPPEERTDKLAFQNSYHKQLLEPIDLSQLDGPNHEKVVKAVVRAAEKLGFFQIINHGVPLELLESLINATNRFFAQPTQRKAVFLKGVSPCPRVTYATSLGQKKEAANLNWRDFLHMAYSSDAETLEFWPKECREEVLEYLKSCTNLATRLLEVMFTNLGVTLDNSRLESLVEHRSVTMNYYPSCPNPELATGAISHSDLGILTVLLQDGVGGLQVKVKEDANPENKDEWIEIPPTPGALVVNVGDALQILSNDRFRSGEHRVSAPNKHSRVSIPLFTLPRLTERIGPLPQLVERDGLARYRNVISQDYLNSLFAGDRNGKTPRDFAIIN